jgi:hypothetical protein
VWWKDVAGGLVGRVDDRSGIKEGIVDLVDSANSYVCTNQGGQLATSLDYVGSGGLYRTWYQEGVGGIAGTETSLC